MRILFDGRMYGTEYRGVGRYITSLVENLQKVDRENEYTILLRKNYYKNLRLLSNWEKIEADYDHYGLAEQAKLPRVINSIKHDLVHFPHFNVPLAFRGKFVVTIHDLIMHKNMGKKATTRSKHLYLAKRIGYKKVFSYAVNSSAKIITPSRYVKKDILNNYKVDSGKIEVIYEGFDDSVMVKHNSIPGDMVKLKGKKFFFYAGNAYPHKNIKRLIEAAVYLNEDLDEKVYLVLVIGDNKFSEQMKSFADELKADNIHFFKYVSDQDLSWLYQNSESLVYPSLEEGFGLQGLESMANDTLVAASNIPVFKELYKSAAIYFNPYDFSSIQKTMFDILNMKKSKKNEYLKESYKVLKNYSLNKMAKQTLQVYQNCM